MSLLEPASPTSMAVRFDQSVPVLTLPTEMDFQALRSWIRKHLPAHLPSIGGRASRLDLGTRDIELFEMRRILHLLSEEFSLDITGLYVQNEAIRRYAERELKLKLFTIEQPLPTNTPMTEPETDCTAAESVPLTEDPTEEIEQAELGDSQGDSDSEVMVHHNQSTVDVPESELDSVDGAPSINDRRTLNVHRTLRSGTSLRFEGDVVIFGDVNPGAHVIAAGNILVLGRLRGMVHAGAMGDDAAFILAFHLRPIQLRIARKIAIPPERGPEPTSIFPEIAQITDDRILIEPYRGRLTR